MIDEYIISDYGSMIADQVRTGAYTKALRQAVKPGSVVVDVGTGTGIFALLACRFGARRVYAIEPGNVIGIARDIAAANGFADRIEFIQQPSTRVTLPERADVLVSDLHGTLPFYRHHIHSIVDARERLLAPGGELIPKRDTLWAAVAEAETLYNSCVAPWGSAGHDFDMQAARFQVINRMHKARVKPHELVSDRVSWVVLDYLTVESPNAHAELTCTALRDGTGHGLIVWFDATLADGVEFSNAPGGDLVYGSAFFPWQLPVPLAAGDTVSISLHADLVDGEYIWRWDTCIRETGEPPRGKARFSQTTFQGMSLSLGSLRKRDACHPPLLTDEGEIDKFILNSMDGSSLRDIAHRVFTQFPAAFSTAQSALARVSDLSEKYSR